MAEKWVAVCPRTALSAGEMQLEDAGGNEVVLADVEGEVSKPFWR